MSANHYNTLGVLESAEQIVITAAYRALASMYHPDRWKGNKDEATERMAAINVAFDVLGDPVKRAAYDKSRGHSTSALPEEDYSEQAFTQAMSGLETRWQTAVEVIPDLATIRAQLSKIAHRLAFSFVVLILETRKFDQRQKIAEALEQNFLEQHFVTNQKIIEFARVLIKYNQKNAIKKLNKYVDVLGSDTDPALIIKKIKNEYKDYFKKIENAEKQTIAMRNFISSGSVERAVQLLDASGFFVEQTQKNIFSDWEFTIFDSLDSNKSRGAIILNKVSSGKLCDWVRENLC